MNDNDIIKALECLGGNSDLCQQCAYYQLEFPRCKENCAKDTLDIITRQKAKIEALEMDNAQLQSDNINANMNCEHLQAEIERLKEENEIYKERNRIIAYQRDRSNDEIQELHSELSGLNFMEKQIESKAIKEFAERLKNEIDIRPTHSKEQNEFVFFLIDELVKEMVGEME